MFRPKPCTLVGPYAGGAFMLLPAGYTILPPRRPTTATAPDAPCRRNEGPGITLAGRPLDVDLALSGDGARSLAVSWRSSSSGHAAVRVLCAHAPCLVNRTGSRLIEVLPTPRHADLLTAALPVQPAAPSSPPPTGHRRSAWPARPWARTGATCIWPRRAASRRAAPPGTPCHRTTSECAEAVCALTCAGRCAVSSVPVFVIVSSVFVFLDVESAHGPCDPACDAATAPRSRRTQGQAQARRGGEEHQTQVAQLRHQPHAPVGAQHPSRLD